MHKISFVHVNFQQGPKVFNAHYLPYTAGVLWAYALKHKDLSQRYELDRMLWRREDIDVAVAALEHSDVICFCTYVWSRNYNYTLAREVKARWPNKLIIFGGPEPALERKDFFEQLPFIDVMVCQEGEQALAEILDAWPNNLEHIPGLLLNKAGVAYNTGPSVRIANLDQVPSPYLMGIFDNLIADNPTVEWSATLETNRGCPYQCTFCDWGSLTYNKVKKFDLTRVMDELEWMGRNHCGFITIADANFGMFVERDMLVAEKLIEIQSKYGWPKSYTLSWAKNQKDDVINIAKKLIDAGHTRTGLNLSLQTLDDAVLSNIKRKNLAMNRVEDVFKLCDLNNIPLYTELILGLPGETVDTWKKNFWKLYAAGNHTGITAYQAQLLENAEMNLVQRRLHKLTGQPVYDYYDGANNFDHLEESIEVVTSTATLNHEQMLAALEFTWYQMTFHISGFTTYISRILNKLYGIGYDEFYTRLWQDLVKDAWIKEQRDSTVMHFNNLLTKGRIEHEPVMGVNIFSVNLFQRTTISVHAEDRVEQVYAIIKDHVTRNYTRDTKLTEQLVEFQKMHVARHDLLPQYPLNRSFDYDFIGYLLEEKELYAPTQYQFNFAEDKSMSLTTFCEQIFFARRKNFGKTIITKQPKHLNFVYEWLTPEGALPNVPDFKDPEELMKGCSRAGLGDTTLNSGYINPIDCYIVFGNNYRLYPAESLPNEPFIYEINFSLNHYRKLKTDTFNINKGFLNDCLLRPSVLGRIRNKQAYLYISTAFESEVEDELFERMHTYFQHKVIPLTQIIFVSNTANGAELYNEFCQARGITDKMNVEFIPFLRIRGSMHKQMMQDNPNKKYKPGVKSRDFLCWNRMYHRHRLTWYTELAKRNLVNNCYISMPDPGDWDKNPLKGTYREYMFDIVLQGTHENVFEHTEEDVAHAESLLPLYVDSVDLSKYPVETNPIDVEYYYNDSLIHLVTETHFFERKIHISEKTYKPITYHHPFIIIGAAGTLAELRRMGFKTFNDFWDESYDDCHDHATRMKMVMDLVESISKWSPKQKLKFSHDVADIVNFNYTHMLTMPNKELDCFLEKYGVSR